MTNTEARFNNSLRPRKPEGSLGRTAQDGHLDSHTAPELCVGIAENSPLVLYICSTPDFVAKTTGLSVAEQRVMVCCKVRL